MATVSSLKTCLLNLEQPLGLRTHAAFHLRTINTNEACSAVCDALLQKEDSCLMRHELAYILGQMQNTNAIPILTKILDDVSDDVLVRHEAAEALGAIGFIESLQILEKYCSAEEPEVRETCQLAVDLIKWKKEEQEKQQQLTDSSSSSSPTSVFASVDPAPPEDGIHSIEDLKATLNDVSLGLFKRYRAMFALRNANTDESALALVSGFSDSSALVRHEIAYVLGQMQRSITIPGLSEVLRNTNEHRMVRHEAAEALGAIGGSEVEEILAPFQEDPELVVSQSCDVALDTMNYWETFDATANTTTSEPGKAAR